MIRDQDRRSRDLLDRYDRIRGYRSDGKVDRIDRMEMLELIDLYGSGIYGIDWIGSIASAYVRICGEQR